MAVRNSFHTGESKIILLAIIVVAGLFFGSFPARTDANINPFGGQIFQIVFCEVGGAIYVNLGPPIGGQHFWLPGVTTTFENGPPSHPGQWLLGLRGVPYTCVESIVPIKYRSGIIMLMMGSSQ